MKVVVVSQENYDKFCQEIIEAVDNEDKWSHHKGLFAKYFNIDLQFEKNAEEKKSNIGLEDALKDIWNKSNEKGVKANSSKDIAEGAPLPKKLKKIKKSKENVLIKKENMKISNNNEEEKKVRNVPTDSKNKSTDQELERMKNKRKNVENKKPIPDAFVKNEDEPRKKEEKTEVSTLAFNDVQEELYQQLVSDIKIEDKADKDPEITIDEAQMELPMVTHKTDMTNCMKCDFKAKTYLTLKVHLEMHHMKLRYHCTICTYNTKEKYIVKKHLVKSHKMTEADALEKMDYECQSCQLREPYTVFPEHIYLFHLDLQMFYKPLALKTENKEKTRNCNFCQYVAETPALLNTHVECSHMNILYKCLKCEEGFGSSVGIRGHIITKHTSQLQFARGMRGMKMPREVRVYVRKSISKTCLLCNNQLIYNGNFTKHIQDNHPDQFSKSNARGRRRINRGEGAHPCKECDYSATMKANLRSHIMLKHMKTQFNCTDCQFSSKSMFFMLNHVKQEHNNDTSLVNSMCGSCSLSMDDIKEFKKHGQEIHYPFLPVGKKGRGGGKWGPYKRKGGKRGPKKGSRRGPRKVKHDPNPTFQCNECQAETNDKSQIIEHIFENHEVDENMDEDQQLDNIVRFLTVSCSPCRFQGSFSDYNDHIAGTKDQAVNIRCPLCSSDSSNERDLMIHKVITHGNCQYACRFCDYTNPKVNVLLVHTKKEHGKGSFSYSCGFCKYKSGPVNMETHLSHEHESSFNRKLDRELLNCSKCDFQHISHRRLVRHTKTVHSMYECSKCDKGYPKRSQLNVHIMQAHQDFTFDCKKCDFKTKHESALYRHGQSFHVKTERFKCDVCERSFKRKDNMNTHKKNHYNNLEIA